MRGQLVQRRQCAMRELLSLGLDFLDIAILFDLELSYVRKLAWLAGLSIPRKPPVMHERLRCLRSQGLTYGQISERLGVSVDVLKVTAHRIGITRPVVAR